MTDRLVTGKRAGTIATLTLNFPKNLSAPFDRVFQALHDKVEAPAETPEIRAVVLTTVKFISAEEAEGIAAFLYLRKPEWNHP